MYIKGEIGEEVYIKAKIVSAEVFENTANYKVNIRHAYNLDSQTFTVNEKDITFIEACETEEAQPEVKRGPGRPKKATVEDLIKKCEGIKRKNEVEDGDSERKNS